MEMKWAKHNYEQSKQASVLLCLMATTTPANEYRLNPDCEKPFDNDRYGDGRKIQTDFKATTERTDDCASHLLVDTQQPTEQSWIKSDENGMNKKKVQKCCSFYWHLNN